MTDNTRPILSFQDEYRWLSNFYSASVTLDGVEYPCVENAYQAAKHPPGNRRAFVTCTPGQAKRMGGKGGPDWHERKVAVMNGLVAQKFKSHPELCGKLCATAGREIVEGNTWGDTFWGMCGGTGQNVLGKILMAVREDLL